MHNREQMSALDITVELMKQKRKPQHIMNLLTETLELKGLDDPDGCEAAQLYLDITSSALFVFCGNGEWDLKFRQPLELWDKDGSSFSDGEVIEDDDDLTLDDYKLDADEEEYDSDDLDLDEVYADDEEEDDKVIASEVDDPDLDEEEFIDEEEYNDIMDDYEDMYEDK